MPSVIIFKEGQTPQQVTQFQASIDPSAYSGRTDAKVYDDTTNPTENSVKALVASFPLRYLKVVTNSVVEMTQGEKDAADAAVAAAVLTSLREGGKTLVDASTSIGILERAFAAVITDQFNFVRQWLASFKTEVAASTNLANLQARVATLPSSADITLVQVRNAIKAKIDGGAVDS